MDPSHTSSQNAAGDDVEDDLVASLSKYLLDSRPPPCVLHTVATSSNSVSNQNLAGTGEGPVVAADVSTVGDVYDVKPSDPAPQMLGVRRDTDPEIPPPEYYNQLNGPTGYGTGNFTSFLCTVYSHKQPPVWKHQIEVADYCIAPNVLTADNELMYFDGWPQSAMTRVDFSTFELNNVLSPTIMSAWARNMNNKWTGLLLTTICLDVVNRDDPLFHPDKLIDFWGHFVLSKGLDLVNADMILIPVKEFGHYALLVVNFKEEKFQFIDSVCHKNDKTQWDFIFYLVASYFIRFMAHYKDPRCMGVIRDFTYDTIYPRWSTSDEDVDAGVFVMHLMDTYRGCEDEIYQNRFNEPDYRMRKRIVFCSRLANSYINYYRDRIMTAVVDNAFHNSNPQNA